MRYNKELYHLKSSALFQEHFRGFGFDVPIFHNTFFQRLSFNIFTTFIPVRYNRILNANLQAKV